MSEQTAVLDNKKAGYVAPFEIEVSTHNSGDWLSTVLNERFRGRWSAHKQGSRAASLSSEMLTMPDVPGMRFKVTPKNRTVEIYDPLENDSDRLHQMAIAYQRATHVVKCEFKPMPRQIKTLDDDTLVTFLWELRRIADGSNPTFEVVSGQLPTAKEIESLPGRELAKHGPFSRNKPKYKGDGDMYDIFVRLMQEKGLSKELMQQMIR